MKRRSILKDILGALFAPILPKIPAEALSPAVESPKVAQMWGAQLAPDMIGGDSYTMSVFVRRSGEGWVRLAKTLTHQQLSEKGGNLTINPFGKLGVDWDSETQCGGGVGEHLTPDGSGRPIDVQEGWRGNVAYTLPKPTGYLPTSRASTAYYWAEEDISMEERLQAKTAYEHAIYELRDARFYDHGLSEREVRQRLAGAMRQRRLWLHGEKRHYLRQSPYRIEEGKQNLVLKSNEFTSEKWS